MPQEQVGVTFFPACAGENLRWPKVALWLDGTRFFARTLSAPSAKEEAVRAMGIMFGDGEVEVCVHMDTRLVEVVFSKDLLVLAQGQEV